jgi:hypothetical protein
VSPEPASYDPEEFVYGSQSWLRLLAFKDGGLLAKGEVFEHQTLAHPTPAKHDSEPESKQVNHGNRLKQIDFAVAREVVDFTAGQDCDEAQSTRFPRCSQQNSVFTFTKTPVATAWSLRMPVTASPRGQGVESCLQPVHPDNGERSHGKGLQERSCKKV